MKHFGREYKVSLLKAYFPDIFFDQLEVIKTELKQQNNIDALVILVNSFYIHIMMKAQNENTVSESEGEKAPEGDSGENT